MIAHHLTAHFLDWGRREIVGGLLPSRGNDGHDEYASVAPS